MSRRLAACAALFSISALPAAHADTNTADSTFSATFGAARSTSNLTGATTERPQWSPIVGLEYTRGAFFASTQRGLGVQLSVAEGLGGFAAAAYSAGRKDGNTEDSPRLVGMGRVQGSPLLLAGAEFMTLGDALSLSAAAALPTQREQGSTVQVGATLGLPLWGVLSGSVSLSATHADRRHAQTFYGVTPEQASRSGNPEFTPGAGWIGHQTSLGLSYTFDKTWSGNASLGREHRTGDAAKSPLFPRRAATVTAISLTQTF
jgi:outer membrane scaffolding protein for murein synthesis (MipA/OmpV family)